MITRIKKLLGLHIHEWSKWTDFKESWVRLNLFFGHREPFMKTGQRRDCLTCGLKQERYD